MEVAARRAAKAERECMVMVWLIEFIWLKASDVGLESRNAFMKMNCQRLNEDLLLVIDDEMNVSAAGEEPEKCGCVPSSYSDSNHTKLSVTSLSSDMFQKYAWLVHSCPKNRNQVGRVHNGDKTRESHDFSEALLGQQ